MNQLIEKKSELNNNFNDILCILNNIDLKDNSVVDELNNKNKILNQSNIKLLDEIKGKDKIICMNQKTIIDYEKQINSFNEEYNLWMDIDSDIYNWINTKVLLASNSEYLELEGETAEQNVYQPAPE